MDGSKETRAESWQLAILHRTSRVVSSGLSIDEMLRELIAITVETTASDACLVYLPDTTPTTSCCALRSCLTTPRLARYDSAWVKG